jgi:SAM-dependent methyltransferase
MIEKLRSALSVPQIYQLFWHAVGGPNSIKTLVADHIEPTTTCRILDIGCGPGTAFPYLGMCEYTGIDMSAKYIESARERFPHANFVCDRINEHQLSRFSFFDRVLALGVVHHLDDTEANKLFSIAHKALKHGGKLITMDGVLVDGQSKTARFLLHSDRGQFIRTEKEYRKIAAKIFSSVTVKIRHDLLRLPYSHIVMECNR